MIRNFTNQIALVTCAILCAALPLSAADEKAPTPLPVAEVKRDKPVEYAEVAKILRQNCLACHSGSKAEGSLVLESPQTMLKGGDSGPAVIAKKSDASLLFKFAGHVENPVMPPADNKVNAKNFTPDELGLLKLWIDQGATGSALAALAPLTWQPLPAGVAPIYAAAITAEGQLAAAGRGNEIVLMETAGGREVGRLIDPALAALAGGRGGIAHQDLVQALAFNPAGDLLASGGFREIKLWRRTAPQKLSDLPAAAELVKTVAVSPDGKWCAMPAPEGKVLLVELATHQLKQTLAAHTGPVTGLQFSPDSAKLYTAGMDKQLRAWNVADGTEAGKLETTAPIHGLAVINEGRELATAEADNVIRLWAVPVLPPPGEAPKPVGEIKGMNAPASAFAGQPAGKFLIAAEPSGQVRILSLEAKNQKAEYNHGGPVTAVAVSADGKWAASSGENKFVRIWNIAENKPLPEQKGDSRQQFVLAKLQRNINLSKARVEDRKKDQKEAEDLAKKEGEAVPKAKELKTAVEKTRMEKAEALKKPTDEKQAAVMELTDAQAALIKILQAALAADQAAQAAADNKELQEKAKKAKQDVGPGEEKVKQVQKKVEDVTKNFNKAAEELKSADLAVQSADRGIVSAEQSAAKATAAVEESKKLLGEGEAAIKTAETALETGKQTAAQTEKAVRAIAFSADSGTLYSAGDDGLVQAWQTETAAPLGVLLTAPGPITAVQPTAAGLLVAGADKSLAHWNPAPAWTLERTIGKPDDTQILADRVLALEFSPDGKLLASGGGEPSRSGEIKLWNPADGGLVRALKEPHSDTVFAVRFSPDGNLLASSGADRFVKIHQAADGAFVRAFEGHTHHVLSVAWKLDGRTLVSGSADNSMKVWDLKTGEQKRTIQGFGKEITSLSFAADGSRVVAACGDKNVRLTNIDGGNNEKNYSGSSDFVYCAAVAADGKLMVAGGQDGALRLYNLDKQEPLRTLEAAKK